MRLKRATTAAVAVIVAVLLFAAGFASAAVAGRLFAPNTGATRCQVITFMWRDAGAPSAEGSHPFVDEDVPAWCDPALDWAWSRGITTGIGWQAADPIPGRAWDFDVEQAIVDAAVEYAVSQYVLEEIVRCESGGNPLAVNSLPDGTDSARASGPVQWLASTWASRAPLVGYSGARLERFDPVASLRVAAFTVATSGTGDWSPYSGGCSTAY